MITADTAFFLGRRKTAWEYLFKTVVFDDKKAEIDRMAKYVCPGSCVIDVGANVGYFSRRLARHTPGGMVLAFEPQTLPRSVFAMAGYFRKRSNILLLPFALGEAAGSLTLAIPIKKKGNVGIGLAHTGSTEDFEGRFEVRKELVPVARLDEVMAQIETGPVSLIKIDVEGAELLVLRGGAETVRQHRPVVVCEIDGREGRFGIGAAELVSYFQRLDYKPVSLTTGQEISWTALEKNTAFLPTEHPQFQKAG